MHGTCRGKTFLIYFPLRIDAVPVFLAVAWSVSSVSIRIMCCCALLLLLLLLYIYYYLYVPVIIGGEETHGFFVLGTSKSLGLSGSGDYIVLWEGLIVCCMCSCWVLQRCIEIDINNNIWFSAISRRLSRDITAISRAAHSLRIAYCIFPFRIKL